MTVKLRAINFQGIAPGSIAVLKIPTGTPAGGQPSPTLDKLYFELSGGMTLAHITGIRGKINGVIFYEEKNAATTIIRDRYRGLTVSDGLFQLDFTNPKARNGAVEQLLTSLPLSEMQDLVFEFTIADNAPVAGRIEAEMHLRQPTKNPYILKQLSTVQAFPNAGEQVIQLPVGNAGGKLLRIWLHESVPNNIKKIEVRIGNTIVYESTVKRIEGSQILNDLVPQDAIVVVDFIEDGNLSGALDTQKFSSVEVRLTGTAAANYNVYYQYVDPIAK